MIQGGPGSIDAAKNSRTIQDAFNSNSTAPSIDMYGGVATTCATLIRVFNFTD
ncbi:hypothetical protein PAXINDRAFT_169106 [Paxillus involutus ATCC 200175]|uniref:Uncharacterized protein n=1 Tax=Paxillus involutus ATCC 200175 TaxID=664439 RepID=A0A0C9U8J6_PAXIN|nr:hypothetical protein PAXINDRAFT_169106 [Paxillus involutus ATCC 200175]